MASQDRNKIRTGKNLKREDDTWLQIVTEGNRRHRRSQNMAPGRSRFQEHPCNFATDLSEHPNQSHVAPLWEHMKLRHCSGFAHNRKK